MAGESLSTRSEAVPLVPVAEVPSGQKLVGGAKGSSKGPPQAKRPSLWERMRLAGKKTGSKSGKTGDPFLNTPEAYGTAGTNGAAGAMGAVGVQQPDANDVATGKSGTSGSSRIAPSPYSPLGRVERSSLAGGSPQRSTLALHRLTPEIADTEAPEPSPAGDPPPKVARVGAVDDRFGLDSGDSPSPDDFPARVIPESAPGRAHLGATENRPTPQSELGEIAEAPAHPVRGEHRPVPESDERADLSEALRVRVDHLVSQARDAEERGNYVEAASLWGMAASIVSTNPGLAPTDDVRPDLELERVTAIQRRQRAKQTEIHTGAVGRASIRPDIPDLRDRGKTASAALASRSANRTPGDASVARQAVPSARPGNLAGGTVVPDGEMVETKHTGAPDLGRPAESKESVAAVAKAPTRAIPWEEEFDRSRAPGLEAPHPEMTSDRTGTDRSVGEPANPVSEPEVASNRPRTTTTSSEEAQVRPPSPQVAAARNSLASDRPEQPRKPSAGSTARPRTTGAQATSPSGSRSRGVKLAGSTTSAPSNAGATGGQARVRSGESSDQTGSRNVRDSGETGDIPIDPRTGGVRTQSTGPGRRRIDPHVASNLMRAETLAAEEADRARAKEQARRHRVEILPDPPQADPAVVLRREAETAERRQREERDRLAAEKRAADLAYKGPVIRSMSPAAVPVPHGAEIRPGQSPTGLAPASSAAPSPTPVAGATPPAVPTVPSSPETPAESKAVAAVPLPGGPTPVAPAAETPQPPAAAPAVEPAAVASAATPGPALSLPPLEAPAAPVAAPVAPVDAGPQPAPPAAPPVEAAVAGPALAAPGPEPVATPAPAPQADAPVDVTEAEQPVLGWRRFWVPLGGLIAGGLGLAGLMIWRLWDRRHFQAHRKTISTTSSKRAVPGRPVVAGKVTPAEEGRPQRKAA